MRDLAHFDPIAPELADDFWPTLQEMRATCPVLHSEAHGGFWVLTRYEDIWRVARDPETFVSSLGVSAVPRPETAVKTVPAHADPPFHRVLRNVLDPWFTPRKVRELEPFMREVANELIDEFVDRTSCEFMSEFAIQYPARIFFERILGLGGEDIARVRGWSDQIMLAPHLADEALASFGDWASALCAERRDSAPRDDVIGSLLSASYEGHPLTDDVLRGAIVNITLGGLETTAMALGTILHHVATEPRVAAFLQDPERGNDRQVVAIEEFLRFETPLPSIGRVCAEDVVIDGQQICKGDRVVLYYGSGNRDSAMFDCPDDLVLDRPIEQNRHMTFGSGPHRCLGSHLARLELRVALGELLGRLHGIGLRQEVRYRPAISRGPHELHLTYNATG
jgi:cytochrome P450